MKNIYQHLGSVGLLAALALPACIAEETEIDPEALDAMDEEVDTERYRKPIDETEECTYYKSNDQCGWGGDCYYWYSTVYSDALVCGGWICRCDEQP